MSHESESIRDAKAVSDGIKRAELQYAAERDRVEDILKLCKAGDMSVRPRFAEFVRGDKYFTPSLGDVLTESLDYPNGPTMYDLLALVCKVAYSHNDQRDEAKTLLNLMAATHAYHNVETE